MEGRAYSWHAKPQPLENFTEGDIVSGSVTSVNQYGAYVNFGSTQDGLLASNQVPGDLLEKGQFFNKLAILSIDFTKRRVALSLPATGAACETSSGTGRAVAGQPWKGAVVRDARAQNGGGCWQPVGATPLSELRLGAEVTGKTMSISHHGISVDIGAAKDAHVPWKLSALTKEEVHVGQTVEHLAIDSVDVERGRIVLRGGKSFRTRDTWNGWNASHKQQEWTQQAWEDSGQGWFSNGWETEASQGWHQQWHGNSSAAEVETADTWWHVPSADGDERRAEGTSEAAMGSASIQETLKAQCFQLLDVEGDRRLRIDETPRFAGCTGFDGTSEASGPPGLTLPTTATAEDSVGRHALNPEPLSRVELQATAFSLLDTSGCGRLRASELRTFAVHTGFDGDDAVWASEYRLLCGEAGVDPVQGFDKIGFGRILDDEENGSFCTDDELRDLVQQLTDNERRADTQAPSDEPKENGWTHVETLAPTPVAKPLETHQDTAVTARVGGPGTSTAANREQLKAAVFELFDKNGDGRLCQAELRSFAAWVGFDGNDEEWVEEFTMLCQEVGAKPARGIDLKAFGAMVDDESDKGCFSTDLELKAILETSAKKDEKAVPITGASLAPQTRKALVKAVFEKLDIDTDGCLRSQELNIFGQHTGFDGNDQEWEQEYVALCEQAGCRPSDGLGLEDFTALVDDDSDKGCYCDDAELRSMLTSLSPRPVEQKPGASPTATQGQGKQLPKDPWAKQATDPWAAAQDPWAAPAAVADKRGAAAATGNSAQEWSKWAEAGKPGADADFSNKPALNAQKLLEASRQAVAARKAAAAEAEQLAVVEGVDVDDLQEQEGTRTQSSSSKTVPRRKAVSMEASLSELATAIARTAEGDRSASYDLVDAIAGAPNVAHAVAVASSAFKALLSGRLVEAQRLLSLEALIVQPFDGESALLYAVRDVAKEIGVVAAPLLMRALLVCLAKVDDKRHDVRSAAAVATEAICTCSDPFAVEALLPALIAAMDFKRSPQMKLQALQVLLDLCCRGEGEDVVVHELPRLLPVTVALLTDTSADVRSAAGNALEMFISLSGNVDLDPHLDEILGCVKHDRDISKCVKELAEVVFVQPVEPPALAVVLPVLTKGLKSRSVRTQRQACIIAENMGRLVSAVADVQPFAPHLLPPLKRISEDAADPDVRAVAARAHASLAGVATADIHGKVRQEFKQAMTKAVEIGITEGHGDADVLTPCPASVRDMVLDYAVVLCRGLSQLSMRNPSTWRKHLFPLFEPLLPEARVEALIAELHRVGGRLSGVEGQQASSPDMKPCDADRENSEDEDPNVPLGTLCDCTFTLACGAATLLNCARLKLCRGRVYGLVGANDSGKSTLLRAIHERRVAGLPSTEDLVSTLVEHGVGEQAPYCELTPSQFVLAQPGIHALRLQLSDVNAELRNLGFDEGSRMKKPIKTLSGGWQMKLGLACAMLQSADLLLLDEPTGHLDAAHQDWLVSYIQQQKEESRRRVTVLVVSHDVPFLDKVCTHVIHVQGGQLETYRGNVSNFLSRVPAAQLHESASPSDRGGAVPLAVTLPSPGMLEGMRSPGKRFLYLDQVHFTYPGNNVPAVRFATVECSLKTRVAVVGPNGAGKSTLAALVVGELAPDTGGSWRHPNLRVAFVAQHTFHHLERHLDLSATEYILWRFAGNEDREASDFKAEEREVTEHIFYRMKGGRLARCGPGDEGVLEASQVVDRRQRGRLGYEYEVRWRGRADTTWLSANQLASMGQLHLVKRENERQAAQQSLSGRALTTPGVEAHLAGFGLSAQEATHRRLGALSSGQRARAVLGAATWFAPHLLVLDEPTNYLDRPSLAALKVGLQSFSGGVLLISHTVSFLEEVCTEQWVMNDGVLTRKGVVMEEEASPAPRSEAEAKAVAPAQTPSGGGPSTKAAAAREAKAKKKAKRLKELKRKNGEDVSEDEDFWES